MYGVSEQVLRTSTSTASTASNMLLTPQIAAGEALGHTHNKRAHTPLCLPTWPVLMNVPECHAQHPDAHFVMYALSGYR